MASGTIPNSVTESSYTPSVSKTSGASSYDSGAASSYGKVVNLSLTFSVGNTAVAAGSNTFVGTVSGVPLPFDHAVGVGYYSSTCLMANLESNGSLTVRVLAAQKPAASVGSFEITFLYLSI